MSSTLVLGSVTAKNRKGRKYMLNLHCSWPAAMTASLRRSGWNKSKHLLTKWLLSTGSSMGFLRSSDLGLQKGAEACATGALACNHPAAPGDPGPRAVVTMLLQLGMLQDLSAKGPAMALGTGSRAPCAPAQETCSTPQAAPSLPVYIVLRQLPINTCHCTLANQITFKDARPCSAVPGTKAATCSPCASRS